jgi:small GTP-binding protein
MDLRSYEHAKFELASLLRSAAALDPDRSDEARTRFQDLFARLAEDRFNLVVVGRFSRGKTSLLNALMGTNRLPVGIVPLTSVITTVGYGSEDAAVIHYEASRLATTIPLEALPEYVTQHHNPGNIRGVARAEIRLPVEILRRGFHFVDTPGLGSSISANTRTTEAFLPEADAFILVTSFESALSIEELQVLREASVTTRRVFVVVNKQDTVSTGDREEALRYVRSQLRGSQDDPPPPVYSVSARDGLAARRSGDAGWLEASGIPALEADLTRFLIEDKQREFLLRFCDRVDAALALCTYDGGDVAPLRRRLLDLSARIAAAAATPRSRDIPPIDGNAAVSLARLEACEICREITATTFDFLRHFQYDLAVDAQAQQQHADHGGLCALHTWQYATIASVHGVCSGYPALLERMSERLRAIASNPKTAEASSARVRELLPREHSCAVCRVCATARERAVNRIVERWRIDPGVAARSHSVLCLQHIGLILERLEDPKVAESVIAREAWILDRVAEDMRRYATKHDAIRRQLASAEEIAAGERAIKLIAGLRNVTVAPLPS